MADSIIVLDSVDSTNRYCLREAACLASGTVVMARTQTAGRGRHGRSWWSPPGVNLYASLLLKPPFVGEPRQILPQLAALAVLDVARAYKVAGAWIKWPNDVFCGDRKLAGILLESALRQGDLEAVVIGFGLNLNLTAEQAALIDRPATSILLETGREARPADALEALLGYFSSRYQEVQRFGDERIYADWRAASRLLGRQVCIIDGDTEVTGLVRDLGRDGSLCIVLPDGSARTFRNGEVSLRLTGTGGAAPR